MIVLDVERRRRLLAALVLCRTCGVRVVRPTSTGQCFWCWARRGALALALLSVFLAQPARAHEPAIVLRIVDCDTMAVAFERLPDERREIVVRVRGISAPESRGPERPLGRACTAHLRDLLPLGTRVWLLPPFEPSVGWRWGAGVLLSPAGVHDLGEELVREGWALRWTDWKRDPRPSFDPAAPYPLDP